MDGLTLEDVVRKFDLRFDRIEQFLPTLATQAELQAGADRLAGGAHGRVDRIPQIRLRSWFAVRAGGRSDCQRSSVAQWQSIRLLTGGL